MRSTSSSDESVNKINRLSIYLTLTLTLSSQRKFCRYNFYSIHIFEKNLSSSTFFNKICRIRHFLIKYVDSTNLRSTFFAFDKIGVSRISNFTQYYSQLTTVVGNSLCYTYKIGIMWTNRLRGQTDREK